jgi:phage terminase large subunit
MLIKGAKDPLRILCAREFQTSIRDSVHKLLCDQIEGPLGLLGFYEITQNSYQGLKTAQNSPLLA